MSKHDEGDEIIFEGMNEKAIAVPEEKKEDVIMKHIRRAPTLEQLQIANI